MQAPPREQHRKSAKEVNEKLRKKKREDRGFEEVPLFAVGHQSGKQRFPPKGRLKPPKINIWRNNLTACSQHHNLYFVACLDWIYVYEPQYPHQALAERAHLKWQLPVSRYGLPGYIPPESLQDYSPHSVNNLLVANLGNNEVILCACDDGDVIAYHTAALVDGAQSSGDHTSGLPFESATGRRPKPFFHQNVGKSAWGLAVHTEARLIAVSSNSHNVTVFAPALHRGEAGIDPVEASIDPVVNASEAQPIREGSSLLGQRHFNRRRVLKRHSTNIPSVSFCNSPEDPKGCYLASTDISGVTIIWDVDMGKLVRMLGPLRQGSDDDQRYADDYDSSRDGWGVMFLDPRCFSRTQSIVQAMGTCFRVKHDLNAKEPRHSLSLYEISDSQTMVRNSADWSIVKKPPSPDPSSELSTPMVVRSDRYVDGSDDDDGEETDQSRTQAPEPGNTPTSRRAKTLENNILGIIPEDKLGPGISQHDLMGHRWSIFSHYTIQNPETPKSHLPQIPLLVLNPHKIHLFQSPDLNLRERGSDPYPVIYLEDPLAQQVPPSLAIRLNQMDRMNLQVQIPELGIILVGSPKGRVAILTLHLLEPARDAYTGQLETDIEEPMYTMRLDHLLPLKAQEEQNQRPLQPLVGIAASPVFGMESRRPRYRVFLSYLHHTVLSYEIGREGSGFGGLGDVFDF